MPMLVSLCKLPRSGWSFRYEGYSTT